jgi:cyclophilin family peptidyl-prolyl cis-trans isomerase
MPQNNQISSTPSPINLNSATTIPSPTETSQSEPMVSLKTKYGEVIIKLYQKDAPNTVANFIIKSKSGFYRSLTFHRVEPMFVVQGGDPLGNGTGGGQIASEINTIPFRRGSVGLARGGNKAVSNDSQFFICLATESCSSLTNEYVNFGEVVSGMEFIDQTQIGDQIIDITDSTK